ncbi:hypothetical protein [Tsuneonella sp. HG222]
MPDWINPALWPLKAKLIAGGLALLAAAAIVVIKVADNRDRRMIETAQDSGAAEAVAAGHETTLDQLGEASHAEAALNRGGERNAVRYRQCLLDSDRPGACERLKPL